MPPSKDKEWDVPPPTDGPNTRARAARGLTPFSGSTAPLRAEEPQLGYPTPSDSPKGDSGAGDPAITAEGWAEWNEMTLGGTVERWEQEVAHTYEESDFTYQAPSTTTTTTIHETFYAIDPSLDFPLHSDGRFPLAYDPSLIHPPQSYAPDDRRVVSTASMIDHGSPPSSPILAASASLEMSREEWLRLGGFGETAPPAAPKPKTCYSSAPLIVSDVDTAGRTTSYSFPSLGEALAPISSSPYGLPSSIPHPIPSILDQPSNSSDILVHSAPPSTAHSAPPSTRAPRSPRKKAAPYQPYHAQSTLAISFPLPLIPLQQEFRLGTHGRKFSAAHIPRPRNSFILFRSYAVSSGLIPKNLGITDHKNISKIVAGIWKNLSVEERAAWDLAAEEEKRVHRERWPDYQYKPKTKGVDGGTKAAPKKRRKTAAQEEETFFVDDGTWRVPKGKNQWSSKECELVAQAVLEGQEIGITEYVAGELERDGREVRQPFEQSFAGEASTSAPPPPLPRPSTSPSTPSKKSSSAFSTPRKTRSSLHQTPKSSSPSDPLRSPASDTSSSTTPVKHSRFARRNTTTASPGGLWRERSAQSPASPTTSPQHPSTSPHPLSRSHPPSSAPPLFDPSTRMQRDQSYAMAQLGVSHSHDPFALPSAPSPFLAGFDNSPLLGGTYDRKFSLGRWELRKPSTTISRREMRAQEEETGPNEFAQEGAFASLDTRSFFDEAFGSEMGSESAWGYTQSEPIASSSSSARPGFVQEPTFDAFHFGAVDLFAPPPPPLARPVGKKGSGGSGSGKEEGLDFGLRIDERGSTYSGSSGYGGMTF